MIHMKSSAAHNTVAFCMVATGQPVWHVATFAKLATKALKYTIYSNFGTCRPRRAEIPKPALRLATGPALCVTPLDIATQPAQRDA
jgi:hypothetical protein